MLVDPPLPLLFTIRIGIDIMLCEVTDLGDKNAESSQGQEEAGSSTASESHGLVLGLNENPLQGNVVRESWGGHGSCVAHHNERNRHEENEGLELQGLQWPSLFQSLATRTSPPSHVRITGVGDSKKELIETGDRLAGFAESLDLPFEFHPVVDRLEDVRLWMLHVKERESVAINCTFQMHKVLYDSTGGALKDFLGVIRSTNPSIVVMAEQEAELNEPILEARFCNALKYYSAIFDSIDSSGLPLDSQVRMKIEEMLAREIAHFCVKVETGSKGTNFAKWEGRSHLSKEVSGVPNFEREFSESIVVEDAHRLKIITRERAR
ncbi:hypothetical protein Leryth_024238 [Lithospermum erythrorhizon]|nr:hypothetical protein Leryth_024238 [Lithospermum erythrorhizon]